MLTEYFTGIERYFDLTQMCSAYSEKHNSVYPEDRLRSHHEYDSRAGVNIVKTESVANTIISGKVTNVLNLKNNSITPVATAKHAS